MDIRCFKDIKKEYYPSVIWDWCAKPTPEEIDSKLFSFSEMGFLRVYIRPSKGLVTGYLSDDYFELIRTACRRSEKHGIEIRICDENSSSSGSGGGEITSVGDYRMKDIVLLDEADLLKTDEVLENSGKEMTVLRDMSLLRGSKRLPVSDVTDDFVCRCFIEEVYDKYLKNCKRFIGTEIKGFSTRIALPEAAVLYSKKAFESFSDKELLKELLSENASHYKAEYYDKISSLISESFTSCILKKCRDNNVSLSVTVSGASFISRQRNYLECTNPYVEISSEKISLTDIKLLTSACAISGKFPSFRIKAPSFSRAEDRFNTALFLTSFGAVEISFESAPFSLSDRRKYEPYTTVFSKTAEKEISNRLARLCHLAASTEENADLLVVYPSYAINSVYGNDLSKADSIIENFENLLETLVEKGISFHVFDESILAHYGKANGCISLGEKSYKNVLLPCTALFSESTLSLIKNSDAICFSTEKILSFDESGTKIIDDFTNLFSLPFSIFSDVPVYINRREDSNGEYVYIYSQSGNANITLKKGNKKIFTADFTDGELYELEFNEDGECTFIIESKKTVILLESDSISADIAPPLAGGIINSELKRIADLPFMLTAAEENILPLKTVNVCFGHKSYRDGCIDDLHKAFYSLSDGETVKVKFPFFAETEGIGEVFLYIENADSIPMISLNGKELPPLMPSKKDSRFFGVDISSLLANGKNTLALEYKKCNNYTPDFESRTPSYYRVYSLTSFEPVYLAGDFDCTDDKITACKDEYGSDVSVCDMPYYHGPLHYAVKLPENSLHGSLLAVEGDFDICTIKVGKREKTFFSGTPIVELFEIDCGGIAEVIVYNTPFNLFRNRADKPQKFGITDIYMAGY